MAESVELHERVTRVEQKVAQVHLMAAETDREVAEFRGTLHGHTRTLNALRETQVEQGVRLTKLERKVDAGFDRMESKFADVESKFAQVDARFDRLESRMELKFAAVDAGFGRMESAFTVLRAGQERITELLTAHLGGSDACEAGST